MKEMSSIFHGKKKMADFVQFDIKEERFKERIKEAKVVLRDCVHTQLKKIHPTLYKLVGDKILCTFSFERALHDGVEFRLVFNGEAKYKDKELTAFRLSVIHRDGLYYVEPFIIYSK